MMCLRVPSGWLNELDAYLHVSASDTPFRFSTARGMIRYHHKPEADHAATSTGEVLHLIMLMHHAV
jgi:hypothetical protein